MQNNQQRVRIINTQVLSDDWYTLKKYTFDYLRSDGTWQRLNREAYDRGNGAAILLYNKEKNSVILTKQFRLPVYLNGHSGFLTEVAAGLLDNKDPETRILAEAKEETGFEVKDIEKVFEAFMSPGSVTEKIYFFIAQYHHNDRTEHGGGLKEEGEDLEVLELPFAEALSAIKKGEIMDAKTIMLLQYLALEKRLSL